MSVYLISLIREFNFRDFSKVMVRTHLISGIVFVLFAVLGDSVFEDIFKVRFASFLIFGGIIFLLIGIRSVFSGPAVFIETRGSPEHIVGSITMPFMIAPGTISASVLIGAALPPADAAMAVGLAVFCSLFSITLFKFLHDKIKKRNERLLSGYVEVTGRIVALFTGTYAVEMISRGCTILIK